jgi:hypothetical protein
MGFLESRIFLWIVRDAADGLTGYQQAWVRLIMYILESLCVRDLSSLLNTDYYQPSKSVTMSGCLIRAPKKDRLLNQL